MSLAASILSTSAVFAQAANAPLDSMNPIGVLEDAAKVVPGSDGSLSSAMNILLLLTVLTVAPSILILCTSFTRIVVVLGLLRQAIGTQTLPPSQVIVGLSFLLMLVTMSPTLTAMWDKGLGPYARGEQKDQWVAWERTKEPLREFMITQIEATGNTNCVTMILEHRGVDVADPSTLTWEKDVDLLTLIPAFVLSELKTAFLIGFRVYLPFLVIDMVIASVLVSMGMMMLPPVLVSLPFKLLLFVLVDGWTLIAGSLIGGVLRPMLELSGGG